MNKKLTVISWDADYREHLEDSLPCLEAQTVLDQLDIIHIEWTKKQKPEVLKRDFIKLVNMNLEKDEKKMPHFDTGLQWNLGLYLANTEWVTYHHNDIVPANHYEKIIRKIDEISRNENKIIYFEGWHINQAQLFNNRKYHQKNYNKWKDTVATNLHLIPDLFIKENSPLPQINGIACTCHKNKIIQEVGGWSWNHGNERSEQWNGISYRTPKNHEKGTRNFLLELQKAQVGCREIYTYGIPHDHANVVGRQKIGRIYDGGTKHYNEFVKEWLPENMSRVEVTER